MTLSQGHRPKFFTYSFEFLEVNVRFNLVETYIKNNLLMNQRQKVYPKIDDI